MYFNEPNQVLCGIQVPHIFEEHAQDSHKPIVDRYFTRYYFIPQDTTDQDHLVLIHSNRICLIGLAPQHVALTKRINKLDYNIGNCDRSENKVKGKSKKGAMALQPTSALAMVHCTDGSQYKVFSCITGKLIEVNEALIKSATPDELLRREGDGFIAILLPKIEMMDAIKGSLLSEEQYKALRE